MYNIMWEMIGAAAGQAAANMLSPAFAGMLAGFPLLGGIKLDGVADSAIATGTRVAIVNMWAK